MTLEVLGIICYDGLGQDMSTHDVIFDEVGYLRFC